MRFYFHEDAEAEFDRAVEYYESLDFFEIMWKLLAQVTGAISGMSLLQFSGANHKI